MCSKLMIETMDPPCLQVFSQAELGFNAFDRVNDVPCPRHRVGLDDL